MHVVFPDVIVSSGAYSNFPLVSPPRSLVLACKLPHTTGSFIPTTPTVSLSLTTPVQLHLCILLRLLL